MEVTAKAKFIRMSPRKVRLVVDLIRGMDVVPAMAQLKFMHKSAARPVMKLVASAMANAEHNFKLPSGALYIKAITVDGGPVLKRWRARAFGRAAGIHKRSSHISVVLSERKLEGAPKTGLAEAVVKTVKKAAAKKPAAKKGVKNA
ncbi:50S ribosomal protein L22 [Candidatus Uhrbacteria bacterium]|nr:50S ribosomal protein L22 [Candidatus Uhrbacteria bacterium]